MLIALCLPLLLFIYNKTIRGHLNGKVWIIGKVNSSVGVPESEIILRKNGNCTISFYRADFGCSISGTFSKKGDTILLAKYFESKIDDRAAMKYLLKTDSLISIEKGKDLNFKVDVSFPILRPL